MKLNPQPAFLLALALAGSALTIVGCGSGGDDPNYKPEVKLSEDDKAKEAANMAGQKAPGGITPGQPASTTGGPGTLKVPGKH